MCPKQKLTWNKSAKTLVFGPLCHSTRSAGIMTWETCYHIPVHKAKSGVQCLHYWLHSKAFNSAKLTDKQTNAKQVRVLRISLPELWCAFPIPFHSSIMGFLNPDTNTVLRDRLVESWAVQCFVDCLVTSLASSHWILPKGDNQKCFQILTNTPKG